MQEEEASASEVTAVLEAFTGTSVDFFTREVKGINGEWRRLWFTREPHLFGMLPTENAQLQNSTGILVKLGSRNR